MRFWFYWQGADGGEGVRIGPFDHRREAEAALVEQARAASDALEFGTGKAGSYDLSHDRQVATLWRDDWLDEVPLGSYVIEIEQDPPETT